MATPLDTYLRPGGSRYSEGERGNTATFEYIGPSATLAAAQPGVGETWGTIPGYVSRVDPVTLGVSGYTLLTVTVDEKFGETASIGTHTETAYELEWIPIRRPLLEHPEFQTGATYALTTADLVYLQLWREEPSTDDKVAFKFYKRDTNNSPAGAVQTLSANAQKYAAYVLRGIEYYDDFAPVARKIKTYSGGPPNSAAAGSKTTLFAGFPNAPTGTWEWLKTADRSIRAAGQRNWQKSEELTGATKVLIDNQSLYL
jgi:hypothetical protein